MRERTPTPFPRRSQADALSAERARRPVAGKRPNVQSRNDSQTRSLALIAASIVVVAVVGAAADWLFVHQDSAVTRGAQASMPAIPKPAAPAANEPAIDVPAVDDRAATKEAATVDAPTAAPARTSPAPVPTPAPKDPAPSKPKPVAPAKQARAAAAPAKPVRPLTAPREAAPALSAAASAPVVAPPAREVVAEAPARAEKPAPVGPFFETKDVTESPRVAARVEPRLPAELKSHPINEIVIVRALVSQNGHPSRISVLRKSKAGPQLDDVVVAAVNQWTFSPAKKKGEPVSCWLNFGVQVGRAD